MKAPISTFRALANLARGVAISAALLPAVWTLPVSANLSGAIMSDFTATPITMVETVTPEVMLAMSRDHQYFFKAYNDYSDVDDDGVVERTYDNTFEYYGYFHSRMCYRYNDTSGRFEPAAYMTNLYYCDGANDDAWSGNFLNWATMTRMDVVRKILYGGKRSTDGASSTVLERAHLPPDAHSFAKYYNGDDLERLTPYNVATNGDGGDADDPAQPADGIFDDRDEGITICNVSWDGSNTSSQATSVPPLMRVVEGNRQLWASNERWQCTWEDEKGDNGNDNDPAVSGIDQISSDPPRGTALHTPGGADDHIVRVDVCNSTVFDASQVNRENCRPYPNGNYKPTGLLQRYGESGLINFGLVTGSYVKNISGGVLRKNTGNMTDEINLLTDGSFKAAPAAGGIINTLNTLRIWGYGYQSGTYRSNDSGGENCDFQLASITEGRCRSWGNPMSEIYLESLRYFSAANPGRAPTPAFDANDTVAFSGLTSATWSTDPLTDENACAALNVVAFNASVSSYDNDQTDGLSAKAGAVVGLTDSIGDGENISGNRFFIGEAGGSTDQFCNSKTVDNLGTAYGLCPEAPTVAGSYHMAGLAHWARTNDIRGDLDGDQNVRTFAVALATNVPSIDVPVPGSDTEVRILPAYRLVFRDGGGALVDFKIVRPNTEINGAHFDSAVDAERLFPAPQPGSGFYYGKYYINWEDSEQGGDYDQDMWGMLEYLLDTNKTPAEIRVRTTAIAQSTANGQLFGFTIAGTTQDGFHAYSGILGANFNDPDPTINDCNNCRALSESGGQRGPQEHTFTVGTASADLLESPLYYAAKWGGFEDTNGNDIPDLREEWDIKDTSGNLTADGDGDGAPDGDGVPDNYFFVTNPSALEASLTTIFDAIVERVSSGTAAAVVANDERGVGAVYQALYDPTKQDQTPDKNQVEWIGTVHALFIDPYGFLREDADQDGALDSYTTDKVVQIFYDETDKRAKVRRFASSTANEYTPDTSSVAELSTLQTVWNARTELASLPEATIDQQRTYSDLADSGRHILTWTDTDVDGIVDSGEVIDFTSANVTSANFGWLDADTELAAERLVDWIRGKEIAGLRTRVIDYDGDGAATTANGAEVMRLGDVIHSTPTPIGTPFEAYDLLSLDQTYLAFRKQYERRRQVVYVGANDGMLHAFNGGFYDAADKAFELTGNDSEVEHPLGTELWAYVPKNLLPHLQWLPRPDYAHVYYMDKKVKVFESRTFASDAAHPYGWGTVLVGGMRLGGGTDVTGITVDSGADGIGGANADGNDADDVKTKSALVVLDVTDPEVPPTVLAELSPPGLNLTTSFVQVVPVATPNAGVGATNKWYLLVGSGPSDLDTVAHNGIGAGNRARLYLYDLADITDADHGLVTSGMFSAGYAEVPEDFVFVGDPIVSDYDIDMRAEAIYFGTVGDGVSGNGTNDGDEGSLWRIAVNEDPNVSNWGGMVRVLNSNQPFSSQATLTVDQFQKPWVIAGTGRLFTNADKLSVARQTLYGFPDPNRVGGPSTPNDTEVVDISALANVTSYRVFSNGDVSTDGDVSREQGWGDLLLDVESAGGWERDYAYDSFAVDPSERSVVRSSIVAGVLFNTGYTPSTDLCSAEGISTLYGLDFRTGTPKPGGILGFDACPSCPTGVTEADDSVSLGFGLASATSVHIGDQTEPGKVTTVNQMTTGAITTVEAQAGTSVRSGEIAWRRHRD